MVTQTWGEVLKASFQQLWSGVAQFLPKIVVAVVVLIIGWIIAAAVGKLIAKVIKTLRVDKALQGLGAEGPISRAGFMGGIAKWAIWIFAILAALYELGIASALIQTIFTGFIAMLAIAAGLAFGLGGKEAASRYIEKLRQDIRE